MKEERRFPALRSLLPAAGLLAGLGWIGLVCGFLWAPERTLHAYLVAFFFAVTLALGALFLVMIGHVTGARWFVVVRRVGEALGGTLPLFLLLFLPLALGMARIYPWVPPLDELPHHVREAVEKKRLWLNVPFFLGRSAIYLGVWSLLAGGLVRWSLHQDRDPDRAPRRRAVALSAGGLMLLGFTLTFASFDWVMSLAPAWQSSVFGGYVFAGSMTAALGGMLVLSWLFGRRGPLREEVTDAHFHALGKLLLTFVILWAYMAYSQGFLMWIADLPHEVSWYLERWEGGWMWVLLLLVGGRFVLPFGLLLSRGCKRNRAVMGLAGAWMLAFHYLDVFWLVVPGLRGPASGFHWSDLPALAAVVGSLTLYGAWRMAGRPVLPPNDPWLARSLEYESR